MFASKTIIKSLKTIGVLIFAGMRKNFLIKMEVFMKLAER
jgi:hypothetical protein